MEKLKQFFPFSFKKKPEVSSLVVTVIIHLLVGIVVSAIFTLLGKLLYPVAFLFSLLGSLADLYITAGIVLTFLHYFKVIKFEESDADASAPEKESENDSDKA